MTLFMRNTGHLRSARSWGVLGLVLALALTMGFGPGVKAQSKVDCWLDPQTFTNAVGNSVTVTATVTFNGNPVSAGIAFTIVSGPHVNEPPHSATTDASGKATFTYTGTNQGTDIIEADGFAFGDIGFFCRSATITWTIDEPDNKCKSNWVYTAGAKDNFLDDLNDPEPAYPSFGIQAPIGPLGPTYANFDQVIPNTKFGHTITFTDLGGLVKCKECKIIRAELEIRLRAAQGGSTNDSISLGGNGSPFAWTARIGTDGSVNGILTYNWVAGSTDTVTLHLENLPINAPTANILSELDDGSLDVYIQDDTGVDYMVLRITTECDCTEIHGKAFKDDNENGMKDSTEQYLSGYKIHLSDASGAQAIDGGGNIVQDLITDVNGSYAFTFLPPGTYIVSEILPKRWHQTFPDSSVHVLTLSAGQVSVQNHFGNSDIFCGTPYTDWETANSNIVSDEYPWKVPTDSRDLIIGTEGDDIIIGLRGGDCIYGFGGNDTIHGDKTGLDSNSGGQDEIHGGPGNDLIYGDTGRDTIYGDAGDDEIHGDAGTETIYGGDGDDEIYGDAGKDIIYGDAGKDKIKGDAGSDRIYGGLGNDLLMGDAGGDNLFGEDGDDRLCGNSGSDDLDGGPGTDEWNAGSGANFTINLETAVVDDMCNRDAFKAY